MSKSLEQEIDEFLSCLEGIIGFKLNAEERAYAEREFVAVFLPRKEGQSRGE